MMRISRVIKTVSFSLIIIFITTPACFSEVREEKEEKPLEEQKEKIKAKIPTYKFITSAGQFAGYDSNPTLDRESKGDIFEEFRYSLRYSKFWIRGITFNFSYNLNALNYHEFTDVSNLMNYVNLELDKKLWRFNLGAGYSLASFYYPDNDDGNILFHTFFFYARDKIFPNLMHQLTFEPGLKSYLQKNTLSDSVDVFQGENRSDKRLSARYTVIWSPVKKVFLRLNTKYSKNDSNARYQDYYDYESYSFYPALSYTFKPGTNFYIGTGYYKKDYKSRYVTSTFYRQHDTALSGNCGLNYQLNKNNSLSLAYTYRNNSSSEKLEQYNENVFTCGWQYTF